MTKSLHSIENARLIAWLKKQRELKSLSMRAFADILGKPHSYIGKVEQGERRLDLIEYLEYCEALGVPYEEGIAVINAAKELVKPPF